uniref:Uncharacterized protein n=1 Tax=Anguilla anguilla TaxID=7936 RepID=A0A0E9X753_ANGAN
MSQLFCDNINTTVHSESENELPQRNRGIQRNGGIQN